MVIYPQNLVDQYKKEKESTCFSDIRNMTTAQSIVLKQSRSEHRHRADLPIELTRVYPDHLVNEQHMKSTTINNIIILR